MKNMNEAFRILNEQARAKQLADRAKSVQKARTYSSLPASVERRIRHIVRHTFTYGADDCHSWLAIDWAEKDSTYPYFVKRLKGSYVFEVYRGGDVMIGRFTRQKDSAALYANLAGAIEGDLLGSEGDTA